MVWTKGQSGNPLGRRSEKEFAAQLRIVLAEPVDENDPKSVRKMRRIAEKLVDCAMSGEPWAIAQVADRIDGKPTQVFEHGAPNSEAISKITWEIFSRATDCTAGGDLSKGGLPRPAVVAAVREAHATSACAAWP